MASIQSRMCRGKKYWFIVESRRVNGKPRPIVIESLGSTEKFVERLLNKEDSSIKKSYSHGAVAVLLGLTKKLDIVNIINKYTSSQREYWAEKPLRNNLTAGATLLLAAIGRVCEPTSKRAWNEWAAETSCSHLLGISSEKIDSQHFWDLMDCIPEGAIENIEAEILEKAFQNYPLKKETLLYDTTNFYTFISSENDRCDIAQRGKNKQKRNDLRQVGMALAVTQENYIPLLHYTYQGNMSDCTVFAKVISSIKKRMQALKIDINQHTIVFDRGCNSKANLKKIKRLKLHYVGALTPTHHSDLIEDAEGKYTKIKIGDTELEVYRDKREIWEEERTVLVFVSERLRDGQLRGIYQSLEKKKKRLRAIQRALVNPKAKKRSKESLEKTLDILLKGQFMEGLLSYKLKATTPGHWELTYCTEQRKITELEDRLGFRIIMTNRHDWESEKIIKSYYGQSSVEGAFKNVKNPYHLAISPQFHWTTQKIKVHYFICVIGYLLSTLIYHDAKKVGFQGSLDSLLDTLNNIRLIRSIKGLGKKGRPKILFELEEVSSIQKTLLEAFNLSSNPSKAIQIDGFHSYTKAAL